MLVEEQYDNFYVLMIRGDNWNMYDIKIKV